MQFGFVECWAHKQPFPRATANQHHIKPKSTGGTDDPSNLVYLCTNCHHTLHRVSNLIVCNQVGKAEDLASSYAPTPAFRERILHLGKLAAEEESKVKSGEIAGKDELTILVPLSKETMSKIKLVASEYRSKGRKVGVAKYIASLIEQHLRSKNLL